MVKDPTQLVISSKKGKRFKNKAICFKLLTTFGCRVTLQATFPNLHFFVKASKSTDEDDEESSFLSSEDDSKESMFQRLEEEAKLHWDTNFIRKNKN